jgi:hypothetical protein
MPPMGQTEEEDIEDIDAIADPAVADEPEVDPLAAGEQEADGMEQGAMDVAMQSMSDDERAALDEQLANAEAEYEMRLQALSNALVAYRSEAINGRAALHIEDDWEEDEDAYEGIDSANMAEEGRHSRSRKPTESGTTATNPKGKDNRSTVFLNITRPYTDAGAARLGDMLLPTDDRSWKFFPTPIADQPGNAPQEQAAAPVMAQQPTAPAQMTPNGMQAMPETPQQPAAAGAPQQPPQPKTPVQEELDKLKADATRRVANGERRIEDWLVECNHHAQVRMVIDDAALLGTGVLKRNRWVNGQLSKVEEIVPASVRRPLWDQFPDPACGENVHNGRFYFDRDRLVTKQVGDLREQPGYIIPQLEKVLEEGPMRHTPAGKRQALDNDSEKDQFEVWYCYATLDKHDLETIGCECPEGETQLVPVMATMINDHIVKVIANPLDTGDFPYDWFRWRRRKDMPYGAGIAREVRVPQRMLNAANRNMLDNAALSSGLILILKTEDLTPTDGNWELHGRKLFKYTGQDSLKAKAEDFIKAVEIPSRQVELKNIIDFCLQMAEQVTGMPLLLQGQMGNAPDTYSGQQLATNNANGVIRRLAKHFDDDLTEPHISRYYDYLQQYTEDDDEKFDAIIDARGSSALVERHIQDQAIAQMGAYVKDPAFEIHPGRWFKEWAKSQRLDPERFRLTEEELAAQKQQAPPPPYQVQVEQMRGENAKILEEMRKQREIDVQRVESEGRIKEAMLLLMGEEQLQLPELKARMLEVLVKDRRERDMHVANTVQSAHKDAGDKAHDSKEKSFDRQFGAGSSAQPGGS